MNEVVQVQNELKWQDYFKGSTSNFYDVLSILFNTTSLILRRLHEYEKVSLHTVRVFSSIGLVFIYMQLFYWLRVDSDLAFYVDLITQTMVDI